MLVNGTWTDKWDPVQSKDEDGRFVRLSATFREQEVVHERGRYQLYTALICPWAHRTLITRKLKGLEAYVDLAVVEPALTDFGWKFAGPDSAFTESTPDPINGAAYMHELYTRAEPTFTGRATVPVLWDKVTNTAVNNESADIVRIFNSGFNGAESVNSSLNLRPESLEAEIDALNAHMYDTLNNGVYKSGFAQSQKAYEEAVGGVFATLNMLEDRLKDGRPYLFGDRLTESDIRLYVTLIRFDAAYHGIFKCNHKRIADYAHLQPYMERLYAQPAFASTTNIDHIKAGYYSIKALNPAGIIPTGPALPWLSAA
mgnify:CR=1 FL=1